MTVPLSDAVARSVPDGESASAESVDSCALMTLVRVSVVVEIRTTPPAAGFCDISSAGKVTVEMDVLELNGMGDGKAKYECASLGESAQIAIF